MLATVSGFFISFLFQGFISIMINKINMNKCYTSVSFTPSLYFIHVWGKSLSPTSAPPAPPSVGFFFACVDTFSSGELRSERILQCSSALKPKPPPSSSCILLHLQAAAGSAGETLPRTRSPKLTHRAGSKYFGAKMFQKPADINRLVFLWVFNSCLVSPKYAKYILSPASALLHFCTS